MSLAQVSALVDGKDVDAEILDEYFGINRACVNQLITPLIASGIVLKEGHTRSAQYRVV